MTIVDILSQNATKYPDEVALVEINPKFDPEGRITWREYALMQPEPGQTFRREITWMDFERKANRFANLLFTRGCKRGDKVAILLMLYPTALEANKQFCLSMLAALACHEALDNYTDGFSIKWPNDIYWKDKKIGGILIENELEGKYIVQTIIGIGLNINQDVFRSNAPNPVSLKQILGAEIKIEEVMMKVVHGIVGGYRQLENHFDITLQTIGILYRKHLYRHKGMFPYRDAQGEFLAEYQKVEPDGHLILKDEQGTLRRYAFKEVEFVLP